MEFSLLILIFTTILASATSTIAISELSSSAEDSDPVIDYLLNGGDLATSNVVETDDESPMSGVWKCGNCTDIDDSKIVYSEQYFAEDDDDNDGTMQIELTLEGMRCVTVLSDKSGVVQRLTGACYGAVTLHVTPSRRFVVHVYV